MQESSYALSPSKLTAPRIRQSSDPSYKLIRVLGQLTHGITAENRNTIGKSSSLHGRMPPNNSDVPRPWGDRGLCRPLMKWSLHSAPEKHITYQSGATWSLLTCRSTLTSLSHLRSTRRCITSLQVWDQQCLPLVFGAYQLPGSFQGASVIFAQVGTDGLHSIPAYGAWNTCQSSSGIIFGKRLCIRKQHMNRSWLRSCGMQNVNGNSTYRRSIVQDKKRGTRNNRRWNW